MKQDTMVAINAEHFRKVLDEKKIGMRDLDKAEEVHRSRRTILKALQCGAMSKTLLEEIAAYIKVEPEYLAGKRTKKEEPCKKEMAPMPGKYYYLKNVIQNVLIKSIEEILEDFDEEVTEMLSEPGCFAMKLSSGHVVGIDIELI